MKRREKKRKREEEGVKGKKKIGDSHQKLGRYLTYMRRLAPSLLSLPRLRRPSPSFAALHHAPMAHGRYGIPVGAGLPIKSYLHLTSPHPVPASAAAALMAGRGKKRPKRRGSSRNASEARIAGQFFDKTLQSRRADSEVFFGIL